MSPPVPGTRARGSTARYRHGTHPQTAARARRPGARPAPPPGSSLSPPPRQSRPARPTDHDPGGPGETSSAQQALRERGASERSPSLDLGGRRPSDNDDDAGLAGKRSPAAAAAAAHSGPARHPSRAVTAAAARSGDPAGD